MNNYNNNEYDMRRQSPSIMNNPFAVTPDSTDLLQQKMLISPYTQPMNMMLDQSFSSPINHLSQQPLVMGLQGSFSNQLSGMVEPTFSFPQNPQLSPTTEMQKFNPFLYSNQLPFNNNAGQFAPYQPRSLSSPRSSKGAGFPIKNDDNNNISPGKKTISTKIVGV
jgi:hypothetical protein